MLGQPLLDSLRGLPILYRSHGQRVVTDHSGIDQPHIGLRPSAVLTLQGVFVEKTIESLLSTVEWGNRVTRVKLFNAVRQGLS